MRIAIIGAGISSLLLASRLKSKKNYTVSIYEKAKGVGGRLSTRRRENGIWDHGAPFFVAKSPPFKASVAAWLKADWIRQWDARFVEIDGQQIQAQRQWGAAPPHYVGYPYMHSLVKKMAANVCTDNIALYCDRHIGSIERTAHSSWSLFDAHRICIGEADAVISTAPMPQTVALLGPHSPGLALIGAQLKPMAACYAVLLSLPKPWEAEWDAALIKSGPISWVAYQGSKPDRSHYPPTAVALARNQWANDHSHLSSSAIQGILHQVLSQLWEKQHGYALPVDSIHTIHYWKYANANQPPGSPPCFWDPKYYIGSCGDWWVKGVVEGAYSSAHAMAEKLLVL